jgi:ATP-dependent helicase/DNAse subunit B
MLNRNQPLRVMFDAMEKHWRAAAWMLERRCPDEFARRKPHTYAMREVREILDLLLEEVLPLLADETERQRISEAADTLIESLEKPQAPERVNPLLEWAEMDEEVEEFKRQQAEKKQAAEKERKEEREKEMKQREAAKAAPV